MSTGSGSVVRVTRRFDVGAERVFDAWLDPEKARRFLFATRTGTMVRCDIDARAGGSFVLADRRDGVDVEHVGEYVSIERPRYLAFTFRVPKYSDVTTRVGIEVLPVETGCDLKLTHEDVLPEWASQTEAGWRDILERLAEVV